MLVQEPERDGDSLLQGDICVIDGFPTWNLRDSLTVFDADGSPIALQVPINKRAAKRDGRSMVMVLSHSCDIENPRNRTGLLIAPLFPIPAKTGSEFYNTIVNSALPIEGRFEYVYLFPVKLLSEDDWFVVDFSNLISVARAVEARELLMKGKVEQLSSDGRAALQTKLAVWIGAPSRTGEGGNDRAEPPPSQRPKRTPEERGPSASARLLMW